MNRLLHRVKKLETLQACERKSYTYYLLQEGISDVAAQLQAIEYWKSNNPHQNYNHLEILAIHLI